MNSQPVTLERLTPLNCGKDSLDGFVRTQKVINVYRKICGEYRLVEHPFTDDWTAERKREKALELVSDGFLSFGAFSGRELVGFIGLKRALDHNRLIVDTLHVSLPFRGLGIGRRLFELGISEARRMNASALYISACSSEETIAFYLAMGAVVTDSPIPEYTSDEPFDLQMIRTV